MAVYILSKAQISAQAPLCDDWFDSPAALDAPYCRAVEADYKRFVTPMAARRMGAVLKRAAATSDTALAASGIGCPDAVVTGTGLGCIENTERFLTAMLAQGEQMLPPTFFINSTHNTISSLIAIRLGCRGINSTYAHRGIAFESALADMAMQFELGRIRTALVGAHDELTPSFHAILRKTGYWDSGEGKTVTAGDTAVSFVLGDTRGDNTHSRLVDCRILYRPSRERLHSTLDAMCRKGGFAPEAIDTVVTGCNGLRENDAPYEEFCAAETPSARRLRYKNLFGESYVASAYGVYVADETIARQRISTAALLSEGASRAIDKVLVINHFRCREYSLTLLERC